jgi:hypothetical protein
MNGKLFKMATAAVMLTAVLSACTAVTGGRPVVEDINKAYTGPEVSTSAVGSDVFMPGVSISVGTGANRIACTAGWLVDAPEGPMMVTAGHCARSGTDAPVSFTYSQGEDTQETDIGSVVITTFKEPYNHSAPDIALVKVDLPLDGTVPTDIYPDPRVWISRDAAGDAEKFLNDSRGDVACWFYEVKSLTSARGNKHCGTIVKGIDNKILIKPDSADDYTPSAAGAPVLWNIDEIRAVPVGIVTDMYKGHIVVDTIGEALEKSGSKIRSGRR